MAKTVNNPKEKMRINIELADEWQDPDSGYLNCIGVGDTYVKKQMERIFNRNILKSNIM